jgi:hypothetical protein
MSPPKLVVARFPNDGSIHREGSREIARTEATHLLLHDGRNIQVAGWRLV